MPSIRDVAERAGVSIATVSRVLNGRESVTPELRERVLRVANACEYTPAVGKRNVDRVALLYLKEFWLESPYDRACLEGMASAMRRSTYDLAILDFERDLLPGESYKQFARRKGVCGFVVRSTLENRDQVRDLHQHGPPMVVLGDHFHGEGMHFAYADSRAASREAVEHLVSLGHRRIGFAGGDRDDGDHLDRLEAFREVLEEAELYNPQDVHRVPPSRMDGAPLARRLLSKPDRPTALFIADPLIAVGVVNEAHNMGLRVPDDLSVVGFDDSDTRTSVFPRMTAVCQDSTMIGAAAFDALRRIVEGNAGEVPSLRPQEAWFEVNGTTAPPPADVRVYTPRPRSSVGASGS